MDCYCDYEPAKVYSKRMRTARKAHACYECSRAIQPGERYENVEALYMDGPWCSSKTCPRCLALREFVTAHIPCVCWAHGNMIEDCIEAAKEYWHEADGLLFGAYRRKVLIERAPMRVSA